MKKIWLHKALVLLVWMLMSLFMLVSEHTAIAQDNDIAPEKVYYDYTDDKGVLKGRAC